MRHAWWFLAALLLTATPAFGQLHGSVTAGIGISSIRPSAPELSTTAKVRPSLGRVPSRGWGLALALNWFEADVDGGFAGAAGKLGTVKIRPLMLGAGYTWVTGRLAVSPSVVAGPALNTLDIAAAFEERFTLVGSDFEAEVGTISLAVRPGVSATVALAPRLGLTGFGGYLFNRPAFTLRTPHGDIATRWSAGGLALNAGLIVALF